MLVPHGTHIMVVDGARLALFRNVGSGTLPKLELIEQQRDIMPRTSEIGADQPGRSFQSGGYRRAAYEETDVHQLMEDQFAEQACAKLETLLSSAESDAILIAAPRVLGQMRKQLKPAVRVRIIAEIDKDHAGKTAEQVATMLDIYESA